MLITSSTLTGIFTSFKVLFNKAFSASKPQYEKVSTVVPSSAKEETYAWLGNWPKLREWIGNRELNKLLTHGYTIKNKDFEATVQVDRNDILDDSYGIYAPLMEEMGRAAAEHPDELVFGLLPDGFTKPCYDGQYFFDTDHRDGDGPIQSNKGTAVLSVTAYAAARAQMMSLTDEKGKPLGIVANTLIVPPQLEEKARKILTAEKVVEDVGGVPTLVDNVYKNSAELLVIPWLANHPTKWFLLDGSRAIKPLIFQDRKKPEFISITDPHSTEVFMSKQYLYGVDCRRNVGYGLWQLAYGSTGTA